LPTSTAPAVNAVSARIVTAVSARISVRMALSSHMDNSCPPNRRRQAPMSIEVFHNVTIEVLHSRERVAMSRQTPSVVGGHAQATGLDRAGLCFPVGFPQASQDYIVLP